MDGILVMQIDENRFGGGSVDTPDASLRDIKQCNITQPTHTAIVNFSNESLSHRRDILYCLL